MAIKENDFINILKLIAPGTPIREGLENILKAKTGALIVIGENKEVMDLVDGVDSILMLITHLQDFTN